MKGNTIMMSLHSKWCRKILSGEKLYEIRSTLPKPFKPPYRILMYCTKKEGPLTEMSGKVVGEFTCDGFTVLPACHSIEAASKIRWFLNERAGMTTASEYLDYCKGKKELLYAWHITDVKRYDVPVPVIGRGPQSWFYYNEKRLEVDR